MYAWGKREKSLSSNIEVGNKQGRAWKKNENKEDSRVQYKLIHEDKGFAK